MAKRKSIFTNEMQKKHPCFRKDRKRQKAGVSLKKGSCVFNFFQAYVRVVAVLLIISFSAHPNFRFSLLLLTLKLSAVFFSDKLLVCGIANFTK